MSTATVAGEDRQYTLTRLPGFLHLVEAPPRAQPPHLSAKELDALPATDRLRHNDARAVWHANLGPIRTPQLLDLHEHLAEIVEANRQDGDKNKPAALVDAYPGLGKTTAVLDYAKGYHQQQITLRGDMTENEHRRVPVIYIALTGNTHIKGLNQAICRFYGLPTTGNADTLAFRAVNAVLSLGTQVFVIDDIHFLDMRRRDAQAMANHLKYLSNAFPVTIIYIGVGVAARGLLREGMTTGEALFAQFGRRTTPLSLQRLQPAGHVPRVTDLHPPRSDLRDDVHEALGNRSGVAAGLLLGAKFGKPLLAPGILSSLARAQVVDKKNRPGLASLVNAVVFLDGPHGDQFLMYSFVLLKVKLKSRGDLL